MKKILLVTLTLVLTLTVFGFNSNSVSAESSHPDNIVEPGVMCENYDGYNWDYDSCGYIARDGHNTVYVEYYVIGTNATARIEFYNGGTKVSTQSLTQGSNAKVYAGAWTQFKVTFYYEDPTPGMKDKIKDTLYVGFVDPQADVTPPVISGGGIYLVDVDSPVTLNDIKTTLSAVDDTDGNLTASIYNIVDNYTANSDTLGDYTTTWRVVDSSSNAVNVDVTVRVVDIENPLINLIGSSTVTIEVGSAYSEQGANVSDNYDSGLSAVITGSVNNAVLGTYSRYYNATDNSGNAAAQVTRTVHVVDTTNPVVSLSGASTIYVEYQGSYSEPGATVSDNYYTGLTATISGSVNTSVLGTYTLTYSSTDGSGNTGSITRTVIVRDTTKPVIVLTGASTIYVEFGSNYVEQGATCTDNYEGSCIDVITSNVNIAALGTYTVNYNYTDGSGNVATQISRTVIVQDTLGPIIDGLDNITVYNSQSKRIAEIMENASATDGFDGDLTVDMVVTSDDYSGNEYIAGVYNIQVRVTDSNGNVTLIDTTITVLDDMSPVITLNDYLLDVATANAMTQQEIIDHINSRP